LAWHPQHDVALFNSDVVTPNGAAGKRALVQRFHRAFSAGNDEDREAAQLLVRDAERVLVVDDSEPWSTRVATVVPDAKAITAKLTGEQARYDAIVALAYPERCAADDRFALLRVAFDAIEPAGTLLLGIVNGYAPEGWRRFHLDPWNRDPWMPDTWRFALASVGFRGAHFYDPARREYVTDVASAGGRLLLLAYR
jgi:hypothetical protein